MNDRVRFDLLDQIKEGGTISDVQVVMCEPLECRLEALQIPVGIAIGAEEDATLIVVNSMNLPALSRKEARDL